MATYREFKDLFTATRKAPAPGYGGPFADDFAHLQDVATRQDRLAICSQCRMCEVTAAGAQPWSMCRALSRRRLAEFIDNPLAACPDARWLPEYPLLEWAPATGDRGIIIGSDDNAAWLVHLFVKFLRRHSACTWPIYCADFGLSYKVGSRLPVDEIIQVPGDGLHPMYRKAATAMAAPFRWGIWYDTDILVRLHPQLAIDELERSGHDLAIRRGELWWQIRSRGDNWHTGVYAYRHGSETLRRWASWCLNGDAIWVTSKDDLHIRDEEAFAELIRLYRLPVHDLSSRHAKLATEFNAHCFNLPQEDCSRDNWHFPGKHGKEEFRALAERYCASATTSDLGGIEQAPTAYR